MRSGGDHQRGGGRVLVGGNHSINTVSTFLFVNLSLGVENPSRPYRTTRGTIIGHDVWIRTSISATAVSKQRRLLLALADVDAGSERVRLWAVKRTWVVGL